VTVDEDMKAAMIELSAATEARNRQAHTPQGRRVYPLAAEDNAAVWRVDDAREALKTLVLQRKAELDAERDVARLVAQAQGVLMARHHIDPAEADKMLLTLGQDGAANEQAIALQVIGTTAPPAAAPAVILETNWWY
jgi:hypothetical protein